MRDRLAIESRDEFENGLYRALFATRATLHWRRAGDPGDGTVRELEYILECLEALRREVRSGQLPPKESRSWGPGRVVTDTWSHGNPLGDLLCRIGTYYRRTL